ncbi:uncharacterized protein LOC144129909 [Amblyomma americanum]
MKYLQRFKRFFGANSAPEVKKWSVLVTCCRPSTYSLQRSLLTLKTPNQVSIDEIFTVLSGHYILKPSVAVFRFRFRINSRSCQPEESVSDYIESLKKLSANYEYGTFLPDMPRERLVCGINDAPMQRRMLEELDLTFESAVKVLVAIETTKKRLKHVDASPGRDYVDVHDSRDFRTTSAGLEPMTFTELKLTTFTELEPMIFK